MAKKSALLRPEWPRDPRYLLLLIPLASVNILLRGPFVALSFSVLVVKVASTFLTAFWEEFLFRGLIQDRLSVLGCRWSLLSCALLFSIVHGEEGFWPMFFAFSVGLTFSALRDRVGIWALVLAHWVINITVPIFSRPTWNYIFLATSVYMVVGVVLLARMKNTEKPERSIC
jgi:membrane protease YdiL (CAAX protease family)